MKILQCLLFCKLFFTHFILCFLLLSDNFYDLYIQDIETINIVIKH
jgi:hypothetical protein